MLRLPIETLAQRREGVAACGAIQVLPARLCMHNAPPCFPRPSSGRIATPTRIAWLGCTKLRPRTILVDALLDRLPWATIRVAYSYVSTLLRAARIWPAY